MSATPAIKVSVIWASPNSDGLTASAKDSFVAGLRAGGAQIDEIHLNRLKLGHCLACKNGWGICRTEGHCVLPDDFQVTYDALTGSDGIVFVTAVYWHDTAECMKAFIDRLRRCETAHNGYLKDKRCFLIACAGGTGLGATDCLLRMEEALRHMDMRAYDRLPVNRFNRDYMLPALSAAGQAYAQRLRDGFDMQY